MTQLEKSSASTHMIRRRILGVLAIGATLSACGGGGGGGVGNLPLITSEPQDAKVSAGGATSFTVAVQDESQVEYQWLRNGVAIAGANEKTLTLKDVSLADHGAQYSVELKNAAGSVQSRAALLRVQALAQVVASQLSENLPRYDSPLAGEIIMVGASGFVYVRYREKSAGDVIKRYQHDGKEVGVYRFPPIENFGSQFHVVEDVASGDILVARTLVRGTGINVSAAFGGFIYRIKPDLGEISIIYQSNTISPSGLDKDALGNIYTIDLKTGDVLKLPVGSSEMVVLFKANADRTGNGYYDFALSAYGQVAVAADGAVYAQLGRSHVANYYGLTKKFDIICLAKDGLGVIDERRSVNGYMVGAYGDGLCVMRYHLVGDEYFSNLIYKIDATGDEFLVAGTPGASGPVQLGSPGVLNRCTSVSRISPEGRLHMESSDHRSPRFIDVILPPEV